jgi:ABC-type multidrug transport system ATPase subunit
MSLQQVTRLFWYDAELSLGLDPESRRQLWNLLLQVRTGRLLFLTTHSMEEADTLCTKIAIMSRGSVHF